MKASASSADFIYSERRRYMSVANIAEKSD